MQASRYNVTDRIIRWAFLFEEIKPMETSSCALFWRCAVLSPLKILAPAFFIGLVVCLSVVGILGNIAPHLLPASLQPKPQPPMSPEGKLVFRVFIGLLVIGFGGHMFGVWSYLKRNHCLPVRIDGGFVKKGACPSCAGVLLLVDEARWECRGCRGVFVPPAAAAVDPQVTDSGTPSTRDKA